MNNEETFYQAMRRQGVTRRSFLKYCSLTATSLGLKHAHINQPVEVASLRPQLASLLGLGMVLAMRLRSGGRSA